MLTIGGVVVHGGKYYIMNENGQAAVPSGMPSYQGIYKFIFLHVPPWQYKERIYRFYVCVGSKILTDCGQENF